MDKIKRIKTLVKDLNQYSYEYHVLDKPTISDKQYDKLYDELQLLENETNYILSSSPTQKVQGEVLPFLQKVKHTEPMLSAEKSKDINDAIKFMKNQDCVLSWKLDGLTLVLRYNEGKFQQAITRGGGEEGEDVTHAVRTFTNVPLAIDYKDYLEIRGEGLVTFQDFAIINANLIAKGEETYSSPRNLAAGSTRQLNANITKERNLIFIAFGIVKCDKEFLTKCHQFEFLNELGFEVVYYVSVDKELINDYIENFKAKIPNLPYLTDGLIVEFDNIAYGKAQGSTGHHCKSLYAIKHNDDIFESNFRGVELNTTRTGMVSITGLFDEVECDGVKLSKASLHNYDIFEEMQFGIGDKITGYRANGVIPQIEDNLTRSDTYKIEMKCPSCGNDIVIRTPKEARFLFCENMNCPSKLINKFVHFCSKDAMNIEGLSEAGIELFISKGFLKTFDDLYSLDKYKTQIIKLEGWGLKSYNKLITNIEKSKKVKMQNFLYGLGIPNIGKGSSKIIAKYFNNDWFAFETALLDGFKFNNLQDFGDITNQSLHDWYNNENEINMWTELTYIVEFVKKEKKEMINTDNLFSEKKVYATGNFSNYKKEELKNLLEGLGATFASGYAKSLDYLIVGSIKGSSKVEKAIKDGIQVIGEDEFIRMINN